MEISTYTFTGDVTTFLGLVGIISTGIIVVTAFRRFYSSPYNVRMTFPELSTDSSDDIDSDVSYGGSEEI